MDGAESNFERLGPMADMLRAARGRLREILAPRAADRDADDGWPTDLEVELETYKHAFETTQADRDRLICGPTTAM